MSEPCVHVGDDTQRVGAAVRELRDAFDELDRLAEQPLLVCPLAHRRAHDQRDREQISPELQIQTLPLAPRRSPDFEL